MTRYDDSANGSEIEAHLGDEFEIALAETPTAGYRWTLANTGPECSLESEATTPAGKVGGSGTHVFRVRAAAVGSCEIQCEYGRSWETTPERTFTLKVRVRS